MMLRMNINLETRTDSIFSSQLTHHLNFTEKHFQNLHTVRNNSINADQLPRIRPRLTQSNEFFHRLADVGLLRRADVRAFQQSYAQVSHHVDSLAHVVQPLVRHLYSMIVQERPPDERQSALATFVRHTNTASRLFCGADVIGAHDKRRFLEREDENEDVSMGTVRRWMFAMSQHIGLPSGGLTLPNDMGQIEAHFAGERQYRPSNESDACRYDVMQVLSKLTSP